MECHNLLAHHEQIIPTHLEETRQIIVVIIRHLEVGSTKGFIRYKIDPTLTTRYYQQDQIKGGPLVQI